MRKDNENKRGKATEVRLLERAQALCGGRRQLAERLGVSPQQLAAWMAGTAKPPWDAVEKAINLILDRYEAKR